MRPQPSPLLLSALVTLAACGAPALDGPDPAAAVEGDEREAETHLAGKVGLSVIGLLSPHYDCDAVVAAFGRAPIVFGYLENTFGNDRRCLNRLLDHGRFAAVRVHLFNGPCVRNRRCGPYEVLAGETTGSLDRKLAAGDAALLGRMRAEMVRVRDLLAPHVRPGKRYLVSGVLEHDIRDTGGARRVVQMARDVFSPLGFRVVNSPYSGATRVGADLREGHGSNPTLSAPCVADLDGTEVSDFAAYANRYQQCAMVLGWNTEMNCLADGEAFRDPRDRRNCPTRGTLSGFARVIQAQAR